jgi:hypothetical protein
MIRIALFFLTIFSLWGGTSEKLYDDQTVAQMITIITTTNPIPSIPSLTHLYPAQLSLFQTPPLALCKKIIVFDGVQPSFTHRAADYEKYKEAVIELTLKNPIFSNTELIFCDKWLHLAGAIREAIARVTTPYVFIHQHDFILTKPFDLNGIIATMEANPNIKHVRLALTAKNRDWGNLVDEIVTGPSLVPLCRLLCWSDNDHISPTAYYRDFVLPQCSHGAMESFLDAALNEDLKKMGTLAHLEYGTYLYGNLDDGGYLYHSNGRGHLYGDPQ